MRVVLLIWGREEKDKGCVCGRGRGSFWWAAFLVLYPGRICCEEDERGVLLKLEIMKRRKCLVH